MKADQLLNELKLLAEKLGIEVSEQNFRTTGIVVKSGFCKVKGNNCFYIDKHIKLSKKAEVLAEYLAQLPLESVFIIPAVRDYIDQYKEKAPIAEIHSRASSDPNELEKPNDG